MPSTSTPRTFEELGAIEAQRDERQLRASEAHQAADLHTKQSDLLRQEELEKARDYTDAPFTPPPSLASQILRDFLSDVSLGSIAHIANTSFEQLSLWLDSPEITQRLAAMQRTLQRKLHTRALNQTEGFLCAIDRSLTQFNELESYLDPTGSPEHVKSCLRNREQVTKSGHLMLKLVQTLAINPLTQPAPPRPRNLPPAPPSPQLDESEDNAADETEQSAQSATPPELAAPTVHPDAMRFPAKQRQRDPLPETHPAILSGAAPSSSLDPISLAPSIPSPRCPSRSTRTATRPSKRNPSEHPP